MDENDSEFAIPLVHKAIQSTIHANNNPHLPSQDLIKLPQAYNLLGR